jgi:hypothetical protein
MDFKPAPLEAAFQVKSAEMRSREPSVHAMFLLPHARERDAAVVIVNCEQK